LRFLFILRESLFGFSWLSISSLLAGSEFEIHATSKIRQGQFSVKVLELLALPILSALTDD